MKLLHVLLGVMLGLLLALIGWGAGRWLVSKAYGQVPDHYRHRDGWVLPDTVLTPGAVRTRDTSVICHGTTKTVRHTTERTKEAVYAEYGIVNRYKGQYEVDHLVALELGGADTLTNLWPEPAKPGPGFHQKDVLEGFLHAQICSGNLSADSAQRWIVHDFPSAYRYMIRVKASEP